MCRCNKNFKLYKNRIIEFTPPLWRLIKRLIVNNTLHLYVPAYLETEHDRRLFCLMNYGTEHDKFYNVSYEEKGDGVENFQFGSQGNFAIRFATFFSKFGVEYEANYDYHEPFYKDERSDICFSRQYEGMEYAYTPLFPKERDSDKNDFFINNYDNFNILRPAGHYFEECDPFATIEMYSNEIEFLNCEEGIIGDFLRCAKLFELKEGELTSLDNHLISRPYFSTNEEDVVFNEQWFGVSNSTIIFEEVSDNKIKFLSFGNHALKWMLNMSYFYYNIQFKYSYEEVSNGEKCTYTIKDTNILESS